MTLTGLIDVAIPEHFLRSNRRIVEQGMIIWESSENGTVLRFKRGIEGDEIIRLRFQILQPVHPVGDAEVFP